MGKGLIYRLFYIERRSIYVDEVNGYGLKVPSDIFDIQKVRNDIDSDFFNMYQKNGTLASCEVIEGLACAGKLSYLEHGDSDNGCYLYLPAALPWKLGELTSLTEADVSIKIISVLKPYLKNNVDIEALKKEIGYVHETGSC